MKNIFLTLPLILLQIGGCGGGGSHYTAEELPQAAYEVSAERSVADMASAESTVSPVPSQKKIIKSGNMGIQVAALGEARSRVDSLVGVYGAYYASENYNDSYNANLTLTIRVPGERFDSFLSALEAGKGKTLYKNISARDVSEEYLDVETRLANKRSYLDRYREILRRATTIKEILEVEEHIRKLEEEIESAEGRLRYLDNQVGYSTLELTLSTEYKYTPPEEERFGQRLIRALATGWQGIVHFFLGLLYIWPFLLIVGGVGVWFGWKRRQKKLRDK